MWEAILAVMMSLQPPGQSIYSRVVVAQEAPAPCDNAFNLLCQPPAWSNDHRAYTIAEDWTLGVLRYAVIAKAIDAVVYGGEQWKAPKDQLWRYVVVAAYTESGFRRDVHTGVGGSARGDCSWQGPPEKRTRIPGSCRSHCLCQIQLGRGKTAREGWSGDDLVGEDDAATTRCITVAARHLDRAWSYCHREYGAVPGPVCMFTAYAGGGSLVRPNDKRILARARAFNKASAASRELPASVLQALGLQPTTEPVVVAKAGGANGMRAFAR